MNILMINSSPRKEGNSEVLCKQFAKGAEEAGHIVQEIALREKRLSPCMACYHCMKEHVCVIQDDMAFIFKALEESDIIVLASPVYFYSITAQMKMMIDRCLVNQKAIKGKKFYYIVTAADPQHNAANCTIEAFRGFLRCLPDTEECGIVYGTGTWDKGDVYRHPSFEQAYNMGRKV
ncbi:MAG TPA: flavodoxin family protein [Thermotogota bacterium]|nr:flavodoxin family protein [Thermotogota bacterium]HPJ89873.1 flavodoxin family protein [Thermotogota bacterium]HPR97126.1 flavodoxin family protein [Thermotogota bacterium]